VIIPITASNIKSRAPRLIKRLKRHPDWDTPLRSPGCYTAEELGLVTYKFGYDGKNRKATVEVRLHPKAMAGLILAMLEVPTIQVTQSYSSKYSGSYRDCVQQKVLYDAYKLGVGHLAAPPGKSWHQTGRSVDLYMVTDKEREAMKKHGWMDLLPEDPPHHTFGARG
jgi:hypothetical protein